MKAWLIMAKSIGLILNNFRIAIRLYVPLLLTGLILLVVSITWLVTTGLLDPQASSQPKAAVGPNLIAIVFLVLGTLLTFLAYFWIAVSWHRYILLEEPVGRFFSVRRLRPVVGYGLRSLLLTLILSVLILIPAGSLALALDGSFGSTGNLNAYLAQGTPGAIALSFIITTLSIYITFRLGLFLPAYAIGNRPFGLRRSWAVTRGQNGQILLLAIFMTVLWHFGDGMAAVFEMITNSVTTSTGLEVTAPVPAMVAGILIPVVALAYLMLMSILGFSILTTLYGHLVEKRPLT